MTKLNKIKGSMLKAWAKWLKENDCGCCHFRVGDTAKWEMDICMGWHNDGEGWKIAWKIGIQSPYNGMQCDMDIDFDMPYDEESGEVYDTLETIEDIDAVNYTALARQVNDTAAAVYAWQLEQERKELAAGTARAA